MMYQDIYNCICQNTKYEDILCSMSNLQPNWCLKNRFKKGGPQCRRQVVNPRRKDNQLQSLKLPCRISKFIVRCDIKGSDGTMLNPIFRKKVHGQKHPGVWRIVEHQIPSIKVLFKTNAKSHKHPGIKLLSSESKTQVVNKRKRNSYRRAYIYLLTQSYWTGPKVIRRKHIIQPTGFGACYSTCCQWDGEDVPAPWQRSNSHTLVRVPKSCVNQIIYWGVAYRMKQFG